MDEQKPGDVVGPGSPQPLQPASQQMTQPVENQPAQAAVSSPSAPLQASAAPEPVEPQQFYGDVNVPVMPGADSQSPIDSPEELRWQADEGGTGHEKSGSWFMVIALVCAVLAGGAYFLTRDIVSVIAILFGAIALLYFTARRPNVQDYALTADSIYVGQKSYAYDNYKGFSTSEEDGQVVVSFTPLKRFMPPLVIHVDKQTAGEVVDALSTVLPHDERKPDAVDALMRKLRF